MSRDDAKPIPFPGTLAHATTPGYGQAITENPMEGVRFGVLAVPGTEVRGRTNCNHPENRRREGVRMPLVFGSAPTEECTLCGAWRPTDRWLGRWRSAEVSRGDNDDDV